MHSTRVRWAAAWLLALSTACDDSTESSAEPDDVQTDGGTEAEKVIRIHYKPQRDDASSWGVQYWGAGTTSPEWGKPPLFEESDDFGGYVDIEIADESVPLGFFPLRFIDGEALKDVETEVLFADLPKRPREPNIAECWIEQGRPVALTAEPEAEPFHEIVAGGDFIDLGDGRVRLMFRVPEGSTGTVRLWPQGKESEAIEVGWTTSDRVNDHGVLIDLKELATDFAGQAFSYDIASTLKVGAKSYSSMKKAIKLAPRAFEPLSKVADWARSSVVYELMVRTFADGGTVRSEVADTLTESGIDPASKDGVGDLVGLRNRLDYLRKLGVNAIWMTPVFTAKSFHGYDPTDFYAIDPAYGTLKDFQDLMAAAHCIDSEGAPIADCTRINIIVDFVVNHVATTTPWFTSALDPKAEDHDIYRDWIVWADPYTDMFEDVHPWQPGERLWHCRSIASEYRCYHKIFWSGTPELNLRNPAVRDEIKNIARFWVENYDIDGFRLDASKHIDQLDEYRTADVTLQGTHAWWREFNSFVKELRTDYPVLLAGENRWDSVHSINKIGKIESDVSGYDRERENWKAAFYASDMDSQFDFGFRHAINQLLQGANYEKASFEEPTVVDYLSSLTEGTLGSSTLPNPHGNAAHFYERFLSNHDVDRPASLFPSDLPRADLMARLKLAASLVFTMPGTPVIYYGEEYGKLGWNDGGDSYMREPMEWTSVATFVPSEDGTRQDFDFTQTEDSCKAINPDAPDIKFIKSEDGISVEEQEADADSLLVYYQRLIALRASHPVLSDPNTHVSELARTGPVYAYALSTTSADVAVPELVVAHNREGTPVSYEATGTDVLSGETDVGGVFAIAPYGTIVVRE
jgi:glycosidase